MRGAPSAGHDDGSRVTLLHDLGILSPVPRRSCSFGFLLTLSKSPTLRALMREVVKVRL